MRRQLAVAATAAMLTALLPLGSTALADGQGPQIIQGSLVDGQGNPVQANITVSVQHTTPDGDVETPIASGSSNAAGQFTVRGELGDAPFTLNPDGESVQLQVDAVANGHDRVFFLSAVPPDAAAGRPDWIWDQLPDANMLPPQASDEASDALVTADAHKPLVGLQLNTGDTLDPPAPGTMQPMSTDGCGGLNYYVYWKNTSTWASRYVPIIHLHQFKRVKLGIKWDTTTQTKLGVAAYIQGEYYQAGMGYTQVSNTNAGFSTTRTDTSWTGSVKLAFDYRRQNEWCHYIDAYGVAHDYYLGNHRWKSWDWGGTEAEPTDSVSYACTGKSPMNVSDFWTSNGHSHTFKAWFNVDGVNLDTAYTTATQVAEHAHRRTAYATMYLCGVGDKPALAPMFFEGTAT